MRRPDPPAGKHYSAVLACILYTGLALAATWPLARHLTTHLPGASTDALIHYWNGWWVQQALAQGTSPFYTTNIFYPTGVSLVTHNLAWLNIVPWLGLEPLLGNGLVAYNLVVLLNLVLCGLAMYWLAYRLTGQVTAAFIAGVIYQLWPYRLAQLDHPNLIATQWIPLFLLFLIRVLENGRFRDTLFTGITFALVGYTRWQLLIPAAFIGIIYFASKLTVITRPVLMRLVMAAGIAAVLLLPPASLLWQAQQADTAADLLFEGEEAVMQTDALAYATPSSLHPVWGKLTQSLYAHYYADRFDGRIFPAYVGLVTLALVLLGIFYKRRGSVVWLVMAVLLISLAAGAVFRLNGRLYESIPTLYRLLAPLTLFRLMRVPDRFNMFLALPTAVLAAYGTAALLTTKKLQPQKIALAGLLAVCIALDYWQIPAPLQDVSDRPDNYAELVGDSGAVYNIPFNLIKVKRYMFDQTLHQRPILQGKVARLPAGIYDFIDSHTWLRAVRQYNEVPFDLNDISRQLADLAAAGVDTLIVHKDQMPADQVGRWQRYLGMQPRYEDGRIAIYPTLPKAGRDFLFMEEWDSGLGITAVRLSAACLNPGQLLTLDVDWGASAALAQDFDVQFTLRNRAGQSYQSEHWPLLADWPSRQWPADTLARGYYRWRLPEAMAAADYTLYLSVAAETVAVASVTVLADGCVEPGIPGAVMVNGRFAEALSLLAYQTQLDENQLRLTLYWRGEQRLTTDYKVFVHLFDPATGSPVAQDDAMPRQWQFPTSLWWPGEVISDVIGIPLVDVPAGEYGLAVGVYDAATGERLVVVDGAGQVVADGRLLLPEQLTLNSD
ncbi:MAG: hypothetical protein H6658_15705 [Ardenticatenaceae bacterium]|nr:hypothetical protein [Ardenticatenaceae bacterium]